NGNGATEGARHATARASHRHARARHRACVDVAAGRAVTSRSPIEDAFIALRALNASWNVEIGGAEGPGWLEGTDLMDAAGGAFNELLLRIGERAKTSDKKTIAASFALRVGWASAMAIAPYLRHRCVPSVGLDNVSFKFKESTFFERTAIYSPVGVVVED